MRAGIIGFKALSEAHNGNNFSRYTISLLHRVGIMRQNGVEGLCNKRSCPSRVIIRQISDSDRIAQLYIATLATTTQPQKRFILAVASCVIVTGSNCRMFSTFLLWRIPGCLDLGNVGVMQNISKIPAVRNENAISEYDPTRSNNHVLGGSLGSDSVRHGFWALFKQLHSSHSGGQTYHRYIIRNKT